MEVLVVTEEGGSSGGGVGGSVTFYNPFTSTKLMSLKGPFNSTSGPNSLSLLRDEGLLVAEGGGKPFLHLWQVGTSLQASKRIICPVGKGKVLGPLAVSPDGNFIVVGISEKINIWQVATGRIVEILGAAHYRPVTVLKFTDDGSFLISAGADGIVSVWSFMQLVSTVESKPLHSWANHSLPVTSVHVGTGGRKSTIFTCSEDRFVKIYSLLTGSLLFSIAFPQPLTTICVDTAERGLFVGGVDGSIYVMNLTKPPRGIESQITGDNEVEAVFKKHTKPIIALSVSADGHTLASSDGDGNVHLWDLRSRQSTRTISCSGAAKNLLFWLNNPELLKGGSGKKPVIVFPEVPKLIETDQNGSTGGDEIMSVWNRMDNEASDEDDIHMESAANSIGEINQLKIQLAEAREINRRLQEFCTETIFSPEFLEADRKRAAQVNGQVHHQTQSKRKK